MCTQGMEEGQLGVKALCRGPGCDLKAHMEGNSQLPMIPAAVYTEEGLLIGALGQGALDVTEQGPEHYPFSRILRADLYPSIVSLMS